MKDYVSAIIVAIVISVFVGGLFIAVTKPEPTWIRMCPQPDITAYEVARLMSESRSDLAKEPSIARHLCKGGAQ